MNLEEFRKKRKARLENLQEALSNMPELVDDKVHGEVGAVEMDAIKSSKERDEKVKDSFKDKNKEVKEFVKKQDKDRKVDKEEESEKRLMLDESLFNEEVETPKYAVVNSNRTYAGKPCTSSEEAIELANQEDGRQVYELRKYIYEALDDDAEFDEFKKKNPGYNKKFNNKEFGKYFDKDGKLIPDAAKEFIAKTAKKKDAKDESLNEDYEDECQDEFLQDAADLYEALTQFEGKWRDRDGYACYTLVLADGDNEEMDSVISSAIDVLRGYIFLGE